MYYGYGYSPFGMFFDPTYILVIIGLVISLMASANVKSTFAKYQRVKSKRGITGAQAAEAILRGAGLGHVRIQHISGNLTDNYDPRTKVLNLSDATFQSTSVGAIGVAAHECGHAIQDAKDYMPLRVRGAIVPAVQFGSMVSWPLVIVGIMLSFNQTLITIGILLFCLVVAFQLITLPVEFNASNRAMHILSDTGLLDSDELVGARKVLTAAALTYVAAAATSILQLLRLLAIANRRR